MSNNAGQTAHSSAPQGSGGNSSSGSEATVSSGGSHSSLSTQGVHGGASATSGGLPAGGGSHTLGVTTNGGSATRGSSVGNGGGTSRLTEPTAACDDPNLLWKTANKTNYTSYPTPGSEECIDYNGCEWAGQFAGCDDTKTEQWVEAHNIVAAFPDFEGLKLHDLCLRKGQKTLVVTVLDTCGDSDCQGCCTKNRGSADQLIDIESYTNERWGVPDGEIEWADLGPTTTAGCK